MRYNIEVNPLNPVEYLACCGIFEILTRFDTTATSCWELEPQPRFWLESEIDEASLLTCLTRTLSDWTQWQTSEGDDKDENRHLTEFEDENLEESESEESAANESLWLSLQLFLNGRSIKIDLDWWYETLNSQKAVKEKSAWKMYAGQQKAKKITHDMTKVVAKLFDSNRVSSITQLIKLSGGMTGRFGFDPRSTRNALDTGYSANDLNLPIATYPFVELLTTIAVQYFFPAPQSTAMRDNFITRMDSE